MVQKVLIFTIMTVISIAVMDVATEDDDEYSPQVLIKKSAKVFEQVGDLFD